MPYNDKKSRYCNYRNWKGQVSAVYLFAFQVLFSAQAAEVKLAWNAAKDSSVAGYEIRYGSTPDELTRGTEAGKTNRYTVKDLEPGKTYYFTVRSHNADRSRYSIPSNLVSSSLPAAPVATFDVSRRSGTAPLVVSFTDTSSGAVEQRLWSFGDGSTASGRTAAKSYAVPGIYTVTLTTTGPGGTAEVRKRDYITVAASEDARPAAPIPPQQPLPAANAAVHASASASGKGLVAAYDFEEARGSVVADKSGNGNDGTQTTVRRTARGRFGKAAVLNGRTGSAISIPHRTALELRDAMTIEAWVLLRPGATGTHTVLSKDKGNATAYFLKANSSYDVPSAGVRQQQEHQEVFAWNHNLRAQNLTRRWVHLAMTYDGEVIRTYIDGDLANSQTVPGGSIDDNDGALILGGSSKGEFFQGFIDNVRIYDKALTADQVRADMWEQNIVPR